MNSIGMISLTIEVRPLAAILPYARNARTHSDAQVAQIAASIVEFGWTNPVLLDEHNSIIAGHGRVLAARTLGMTEVPAIVLAHLSENQKRALRIADNKLPENAAWDTELLALELEALKEEGFDLSFTGFDDSELDALLTFDDATGGLMADEKDDAVPEVQDTVVSTYGDVWRLGQHRIMCGSSTCAADVSKLLVSHKPHLMVTDPPYGVKYDPH